MEFFSIYDITYSYSVTWGVTETKAQNDYFRVKYVTPQHYNERPVKKTEMSSGVHITSAVLSNSLERVGSTFLLNKRVQTNEKYTQMFKLMSKVIKLETQQTSRSLE